MPTQSIYEYADGSANLYSLNGNTLSYDPVRPEESSTGTYSGGDPKTVQLTRPQADSIRLLLNEAFNNTADQIPDRVKGSGAVYINDGKNQKKFILRQGSEDINRVELALKNVLSK